MTLDDLERPISILFQKRCVFRSPPQKLNEDRAIGLLSEAKKATDSSFWRHKVCAGFSGDGASNDSGVNENVDFHGFWTLRLRHLRKWGQHYSTVLFSPLLPFEWPQNIWPWMTLTGYLALKSVFASIWLAETARLRKVIAWKLIKIDIHFLLRKSPAWTLLSDDILFIQLFSSITASVSIKLLFCSYKVCADIRSVL